MHCFLYEKVLLFGYQKVTLFDGFWWIWGGLGLFGWLGAPGGGLVAKALLFVSKSVTFWIQKSNTFN